jgi:hypothetical protein
VPGASATHMAWDGPLGLSWLSRGFGLAIAVVVVLILWYVAWTIVGSVQSVGEGPGDSVVEAGKTTGPAPEGGFGEAAPGGVPEAPSAQGVSAAGQRGSAEGGNGPALASYTSGLRQDLFGVGSAPEPVSSMPTSGPQPADLRLQGVILGNPPQAIIYDARMGVTHVVTVGGQIGEISIEEIRENVVVISFRGESSELRL